MKIVIFSDVFLPKIDGVVTSLIQLASEFVAQGNEVLLVVPYAKNIPKKIEGLDVQFFFLPSVSGMIYPGIRIGLFSRRLGKTLNEFNPDISQIVTPGPVGIQGILYSGMRKIPYVGVFHVHFMKPEYIQLIGLKRGMKIAESLLWEYFKTIFLGASALIAPTNSTKEDIVFNGLKNDVYVCSNGVSKEKIGIDEKQIEQIKKKYHLEGKRCLLYIGRLSKEKNIAMLFRVMSALIKKNKDYRLLLIGEGPDRKVLVTQAQSLKITRYTVFLGEISNTNILKFGLHRLGQVFITCSNTEVQPMSLIEAFFQSRPIIAPKVKEIEELVGSAGLFFEKNKINSCVKVIESVFDNNDLHTQLSEESYKLSKKYTAQASAKSYLDVFKKSYFNSNELIIEL